MVHGLPQRRRPRRRRLPPLGDHRPALLQRRRHHAEGRPDRRPHHPGNLAASATPSTSYVSPWETLGAIKDGYTPANSQDHSHGAYGNWNHQGTEWIEYQWPTARTISRSEVYWFDDNLGIDLPASCQVQYWNGSAYVNVPGSSGCGVAANAFNTTTFTPVSTTRLRLNITSRSGYSTGVLEWRAFS